MNEEDDVLLRTGAMSPKFGDGHLLKRYVPELLTGVIFDVYDQHTQLITKLDVKQNTWHITIIVR